MVAVSGVGPGAAAALQGRAVTHAGAVAASSSLTDRASAQEARAVVARTTTQLDTDEAPRGTPAAIAADHAAVRAAQAQVDRASSRLRSDGDQSALVDVLA